VVPGVPLELFGSQYPGGKIFNGAAFSAPPKGPQGNLQQGNFGRNVSSRFRSHASGCGVAAAIHLTEKLGLRFRSEFFNIFNHPNFGNPNNQPGRLSAKL